MPFVKIALDQTTYEKLVAIAFRELRPTQWQAEILLRQAIRQDAAPAIGADDDAVAIATDHDARWGVKGRMPRRLGGKQGIPEKPLAHGCEPCAKTTMEIVADATKVYYKPTPALNTR